MISLQVAPYCESCPYFRVESKTIKHISNFNRDYVVGDTLITCADAEKCSWLFGKVKDYGHRSN